MNNPQLPNSLRLNRRGLLTGGVAALGGLLLTGQTSASPLRFPLQPIDDDGEILVVIQLAGGNDGLNTIIPHADDLYHAARPKMRVPPGDVLPLDDYRGFHPKLTGVRDLYERGELAIIEGTGYPNPNRSHFASFDIWHAADLRGKTGGAGWLARLAGKIASGDDASPNVAVHVGQRLPYSLVSPSKSGVCFTDPGLYRWDKNEDVICETTERSSMKSGSNLDRVRNTFLRARQSSAEIQAAASSYKPRVEYPESLLGYSLHVCAALIQAHMGARVLSVELPGFDTHARQAGKHEYLLDTWSTSMSAFLADLRGTPQGERTTVLAFSEFGRRVSENASSGTDHGTAGPMFIAGPRVKGGLYGEHPTLENLDEGDLRFTTDFRSVYGTLLKEQFSLDPVKFLGGKFPTLPLIG